MNPPLTSAPSASPGLNKTLWAVQGLLALTFVGTTFWKLLTPMATLATMIPWAGQVSVGFFQFTALVDLAGGLGLVLPALTRIRPGLTVLAALGCAALQVSAIVFHLSRGEAANTPFNFVLVGLSLFVAWGRQYKAPIAPR
ncbi:MAG: DoxX family protein [Myxococcota bacterium]